MSGALGLLTVFLRIETNRRMKSICSSVPESFYPIQLVMKFLTLVFALFAVATAVGGSWEPVSETVKAGSVFGSIFSWIDQLAIASLHGTYGLAGALFFGTAVFARLRGRR
ncbi:hypothetical protein QEH54_14605 [Pelagicoccus sp. SDUM812003]|nr:hypothetical protein [Pelagicoccus sp. SDUM812003]